MNPALNVGICPDFAEECWPSMDRVAAQLLAAISSHGLDADILRPPFRKRAMRWSSGRAAHNADRACNRFIDYPRHLRRVAGAHDVYHVVDHSYAHLTRHLPPGRSVVTCHDLDAFRSIFEGEEEPRSAPFRAATRYILGGLRRAAAVACDTEAIARELIQCAAIQPDRVSVVHLGVNEVFTTAPNPDLDSSLARLLPFSRDLPVVLHVGATVSRKRLDVLLRCFAGIRHQPAPQLVHIGEPFTVPQLELARQLRIADRVTLLSSLDDLHLAAAYRRATVLALPSDREGFGFPVVEALRSGTAVVATDLPVLREVGGQSAHYAPAGDVAAWAQAVSEVLGRPGDASVRAARVDWAGHFTWRRYADHMTRIYSAVAERMTTEARCVQAPA